MQSRAAVSRFLVALVMVTVGCTSPTEPDGAALGQSRRTIEGNITNGIPDRLLGYGLFPRSSGDLEITMSWTSTPNAGDVYRDPALSLFVVEYEGSERLSEPSTVSPISMRIAVRKKNVPILAYPYTLRVVPRNNCGCTVKYVLTLSGPPLDVF